MLGFFFFGMLIVLVFSVLTFISKNIMETNTNNLNESRGSDSRLRKYSKHDANLPKNEVLRFQIGLVISLAVAYFAIEATFAVTSYVNTEPVVIEEDQTYEMTEFKVEQEVKEKIQPQKQTVKLIDDIKVVDDKTVVDQDEEFKNEKEPVEDLNTDDIVYEDPDEIEMPVVAWDKVEIVPVFPGCETLQSNKERRECMSDAINKIVQRNFDTSIAGEYGLEGIQRIYAQFKINQKGQVEEIKIRAPHKVLEEEAERVIKLIPQMTPGKQRNKDVSVIFLKPIVFKVQ